MAKIAVFAIYQSASGAFWNNSFFPLSRCPLSKLLHTVFLLYLLHFYLQHSSTTLISPYSVKILILKCRWWESSKTSGSTGGCCVDPRTNNIDQNMSIKILISSQDLFVCLFHICLFVFACLWQTVTTALILKIYLRFSLDDRKMLWFANGWKLHLSSLHRQGATVYNGIYNRIANKAISGLQVSYAEIKMSWCGLQLIHFMKYFFCCN